MIKNFNIINSRQEIRKWDFDKFYPYTHQIRDIILQSITILENPTLKQLERLIRNTNESVKQFCESKGFPHHFPSTVLCEELVEQLGSKIKRRKKVTEAKIIISIILQKLDMAINNISKEKDLETSSKIIQQSEALLKIALKSYISGISAEEKNITSNIKSLEVKNKVFNILAKYFMDEKGLPKWRINKSNTATFIYNNRRPTEKVREYLTDEDIKNMGKKNEVAARGKKTIEDYIDEFFMDVR